ARVGLFDKPDDLLGAESALLHVRPLGFTDFIASAGTAQWGQVTLTVRSSCAICMSTSHSPNGDGPNRGFFNSSNADFTRWNVVNNIFALLFV
ncbi:hypothetical protein, partial [Xanthomonas euvesicatoria]|uniref:hypothetical protein n=1 Tax=Xanthomonas euvesicatoria TaxID=456327 RepID=UPI0019D1EB84